VKSRLRLFALIVFWALLLAGVIVQSDTRTLTATSFGEIPAGYGALYDVLAEAGLPVARSFAAPERLEPGRTLWWIEPAGVPPDADAKPSKLPGSPLLGPAFASWIEAGGTAVLFFPGKAEPASELAGLAVPARVLEQPQEGVDDTKTPAPRAARLDGPLAGAPRTLELSRPVVFEAPDTEAWRAVARLAGRPFALEASLGAGRLVVVADARFLANASLDRADAAPLVLDLVRAYGVPRLDEHEHGFASSQGTLAFLARSSALPFFVGLALLALGLGWFGATLPMRRVQEFDPSAPTLETYVASLAHLYAETRDHRRVLERYRELTGRRLRRHFGLPPDASLASLSERLARRAGTSRAGLALLEGPGEARDAAELQRAAAALDRLVAEVAR
jgi:hypothetical protein